jgi:hypothetical protein
MTMSEFLILSAGFAGGYVASIFSWPAIRSHVIGLAAEIEQLRARARALEDKIKGVL